MDATVLVRNASSSLAAVSVSFVRFCRHNPPPDRKQSLPRATIHMVGDQWVVQVDGGQYASHSKTAVEDFLDRLDLQGATR